MVDDALNTAAAFDWITPAVAFIQDFLYGPPSDFGVPAQAGWGRRQIKRLLKRNGVRVWGMMLSLDGDILMFTVPTAQAQAAYQLLRQAGVPLLAGPPNLELGKLTGSPSDANLNTPLNNKPVIIQVISD